MAVNYIQGQILANILQRDGLDLSIANANVGINTNSPAERLDVNGNVLANNIFSNVTVSAVGNVIGNNIVAINNISANTANISGNIVVGNLSTTGNVAAGNVLTDNLLYANGVPWDLQQPAGSNTEIQFNNNSNFGANVNFTFDTSANLLTVNATANIANLNVAGNVTGGNLISQGDISGTGNITGGNIISGNAVIGNIQVTGDVNVNSLTSNTFVSAGGNVIAGNVTTGGTISSTGNITGGNLRSSGDIQAVTANLANLRMANTTITTDGTIGNIVLEPTSTGVVYINTTTGLIIPVGNTLQRPAPATQGTVRFNTTTSRVEVYDGTEWDTIVGGVTNQILNGDGSTLTFVLNRSTTTAAALVVLNGITQVPTQAYNMSPNPSVNLVFTEAPQVGDVIDIRFL